MCRICNSLLTAGVLLTARTQLHRTCSAAIPCHSCAGAAWFPGSVGHTYDLLAYGLRVAGRACRCTVCVCLVATCVWSLACVWPWAGLLCVCGSRRGFQETMLCQGMPQRWQQSEGGFCFVCRVCVQALASACVPWPAWRLILTRCNEEHVCFQHTSPC